MKKTLQWEGLGGLYKVRSPHTFKSNASHCVLYSPKEASLGYPDLRPINIGKFCKACSHCMWSLQLKVYGFCTGCDLPSGRPDVLQGFHVLGLWSCKTVARNKCRWQLTDIDNCRLLQGLTELPFMKDTRSAQSNHSWYVVQTTFLVQSSLHKL